MWGVSLLSYLRRTVVIYSRASLGVLGTCLCVKKSGSSMSAGQAVQDAVFSWLKLSFSFKKANSRGARRFNDWAYKKTVLVMQKSKTQSPKGGKNSPGNRQPTQSCTGLPSVLLHLFGWGFWCVSWDRTWPSGLIYNSENFSLAFLCTLCNCNNFNSCYPFKLG